MVFEPSCRSQRFPFYGAQRLPCSSGISAYFNICMLSYSIDLSAYITRWPSHFSSPYSPFHSPSLPFPLSIPLSLCLFHFLRLLASFLLPNAFPVIFLAFFLTFIKPISRCVSCSFRFLVFRVFLLSLPFITAILTIFAPFYFFVCRFNCHCVAHVKQDRITFISHRLNDHWLRKYSMRNVRFGFISTTPNSIFRAINHISYCLWKHINSNFGFSRPPTPTAPLPSYIEDVEFTI